MRKILFFLICLIVGSNQLFAQQTRTVSGKVTDENGAALIGATISAVGAKRSTISKASGDFEITLPSSVKQLLITYTGFAEQNIVIGAQTSLSIKMKPGGTSLENVVVTGYTSVKKEQFSGAVSKVSAEKINFVPMASFDQILQGRVPGLLVASGSGQPGAAARVQIRGQSSISGDNDPLYVMDGAIIEAGVFQSLNPNDFENVQVLKDASSTAQYGNRGSGGVIVITTKKGKVGKPVLNYSFQMGSTQAGRQPFEMMNSSEILQFQEILGKQVNNGLPGWVNSALNPANASASPDQKAAYAKTLDSLRGINTKWIDVFQRKGSFTSHDLNLSGGSGGTRFFIGGGFYKEQGIGLRSDLERYTFRANIDHRSDKLTMSINTTAGYTKRNLIESENSISLANPFAAAYLGLPYHTLLNPDGSVAVGAGKTAPNAYDRVVNATTNGNNQLKLSAVATISYNILKHVFVGGQASIDYRQTINERQIKPNTFAANNATFPTGPDRTTNPPQTIGLGSYATGIGQNAGFIARANVSYRNTFKGVHDVDFQYVSEFTRDRTNAFNYTGYGINSKLLGTPSGITPGSVNNKLVAALGGGKTERGMYAGMFLGRYTYDGKYTLNTSFRRDASSQLPVKTRWQNFYSFGATWLVLKENFAANWRKLSDLKVRVSYGTSAAADNFASGLYGFFPTAGPLTYNGQGGTAPAALGNPNLKWENVGQLNLGVDYGFFSNRISGSLDIYERKTRDVIVNQTISLTNKSQPVNAGVVSNKGVEFSLNLEIVKTKDLLVTLGGNVSYNKNNVASLGQVKEFEQGTELVKVGLPLGSHYIVKWGGVDAATGQALYYTKPTESVDANGKTVVIPSRLTNVYSDDDRVSDFGTYQAPWTGGFNTGINYKGLSIEAFFSFQKGFARFNNQDYFQLNPAFAIQGYNLRREMFTMWQQPGDVTDIQAPTTARQFVSKDIQDASFMRFRNLTISYNLPSSLLKNQNYIGNVRFFAQGQNLLTWTEWKGFDPEDDNNIAGYEYPAPKTYTVGLNVTFK